MDVPSSKQPNYAPGMLVLTGRYLATVHCGPASDLPDGAALAAAIGVTS